MLKKILSKISTEVKAIASVALAAILLISIVLSAGTISACVKKTKPTDNSVNVKNAEAIEITGGYEKGSSRATQTAEYLGEVKPVKPIKEVKDEHESYGVKEYPSWGKSLTNYTDAERAAIFAESRALTPYPTWKSLNIYDAIDSEGYLLRNGERVLFESGAGEGGDHEEEDDGIISGDNSYEDDGEVEEGGLNVSAQYSGKYRRLYAHTAAASMYGGGLSDKEPRIKKKITYITRTGLASNQITGLYAPAGEVIKVEISEEDLKAAGGSLVIYIGQNYNLDQQVSMEWHANGQIKGNGFTRMSDILNKFVVTTPVSYVGSFLGGPIYIRPNSNSVARNFSVTISGGVKYQHFILGATTPEEYELNKASTAPYFDLEVYDAAVRFTTSKYAVSGGLALKDYTYENCTDAAILWDKISQVSKRVGPNGLSSSNAPVMIIGDCYIAAGGAFANPGRNGVVCPPDWLAEALNYNNFVNSGCWGTMHEYNHCWQGYGLAYNGEVTNNATTLVSYSLYTRISQSRTSAVSWGNGGWNRFTDPSKALGELLTIGRNGTKCFDLSVYATLLHNIGQDYYVKSAVRGSYYDNLTNATHNDMTYYFTDVLNFDIGDVYSHAGTLSSTSVNEVKAKNYPMFVPVSSVYQVGRSIMYDGKKQYITTAQPFAYGNGDFIMDFNNRNNFKGGSWVSKALVIPDGFTVKVKNVTQPENGTVTSVGENVFKYSPDGSNKSLYSGNFIVTLGITKDDGEFLVDDVDIVINLKQTAGTTMTRTTYVYDEGKTPDPASVLSQDKTTFNFGEYNETETIKNVCDQDSNTEIWAAGRNYYDETYNANSTNYKTLPNNRTLQTMEGVLYFSNPCTIRFTARGRGKTTLYLSYDRGATWQDSLTIERTSGTGYISTEYVEHGFATKNNAVYYKIVHLVKAENNFFGIGIATKQADGSFSAFSHANAIPTSDISVFEATREEATKKFTTEYRFKNEYKYDYNFTDSSSATEHTPISVNRTSWDGDKTPSYAIGNMFDGNDATNFLSNSAAAEYVTVDKPFELVVDMGRTLKANSVTFYGFNSRNNGVGNLGMPHSFKLYGSTDNVNYTPLVEKQDEANTTKNVTFTFDETQLRYYKLVVTKTDNGRYFGMNKIEFSFTERHPGGILVAPNDGAVKYTGTWGYQNELCNFGIIYTAGVGDYVEFSFTGSRFAYFAYQSKDYGTVDIYVDGKKYAEGVSLNSEKNVGSLAFMVTGTALKDGEHVVKIVGKSGHFNVDSFAYWA